MDNNMAPRPWHQLAPAEQAAEWARYHHDTVRWGAPPQSRPGTNTAALVSLASGLLGLLILPFLLGAVAVVAGIVGWAKAREEGYGKAELAVVGAVLGVLGVALHVLLAPDLYL